MRSHAQLHVSNQEISRANNFAAEEPSPASFTWLRNVLRSVTHDSLCDTTATATTTTTTYLPTTTTTKSLHFKPSILVFLPSAKKHRWKKYCLQITDLELANKRYSNCTYINMNSDSMPQSLSTPPCLLFLMDHEDKSNVREQWFSPARMYV